MPASAMTLMASGWTSPVGFEPALWTFTSLALIPPTFMEYYYPSGMDGTDTNPGIIYAGTEVDKCLLLIMNGLKCT